MKTILKSLLPIVDLLAFIPVFLTAFLFKAIRRAGVQRMPLSRRALLRAGMFPIRRHYYEPLFDPRGLRHPLSQDRDLPGIHWNTEEQLRLLKDFRFNEELKSLPAARSNRPVFRFDNEAFSSGDAEYLYHLIRLKKPSRLIEVGSGHSTLIAMEAVDKSREEDPRYACEHLCIEPYEMPWLENTGVSVLRKKVEDLSVETFARLGKDDLLFIDSSHMIRPQGDVLFEFLTVLPSLKTGVIVHVHDIFSPKDYPEEWVREKVLFWNEQYLLEAFLTSNRDWKVIGALNYLHHHHYDRLKTVCPYLTRDREPGSFYIQKTS